MAVRSKRLWLPTAVSTGTVTLYTCPTGETALLKQITLVNNSPLTNTILLRLNGDLAANNLLAFTVPGSASDSRQELFIVLHPGDFLRAVSTAASIVIGGFGAELEGVAD